MTRGGNPGFQFLAVMVLIALAHGASPGGRAGELVVESDQVSLRFHEETGAWVGLVDRPTGENLVVPGGPGVGPVPPAAPKLDLEVLSRACREGRALDLTGAWDYLPVGASPVGPPPAEAGEWRATPVPSRRGEGDDRLHDQVGDFWYRRLFVVPAEWPDEEGVLIVGAVDDFDVAYLNGGQPIGATGQETPRYWESPRWYRFGAERLRRGGTNTLVLRVTNGAGDGGIQGPVILGVASQLPRPQAELPRLSGERLDSADGWQRLQLMAREGPWEYIVDFRVPKEGDVFSRQLSVRNVSTEEQLFQTATLVTPRLRLGARSSLIFPGSLPVGDLALDRMTNGVPVRPRSEEALTVVWDAEHGRGLGLWYHTEEETTATTVQRVDDGFEVRHTQQVIARLRPRELLSLGRQYFWIGRESRLQAVAGVQWAYERVGLRAPTNGLPGLGGKVIYCGHPGGVPERGFRGFGGFNALREYLPALQQMGVNLLWLLPIWEHGDGREWNLYAPFDHFRVSPLYGTPEELRALSAAATARGIGLMFDLVPHGPPDFTPLAKAHPEWVARDPEGRPQRAWNQLAFDNAHPGWQDYMRRAAAWGRQEFGALGARVDCAAGGPMNWNRAVRARPSLSGLWAGLGMSRAIREGYLQAGTNVVLLPEEYTGLNVFHRVADLTYDAQFYFLQMELQAARASPEEWAVNLQAFLRDQQAAAPPGALKLRWISNHDTVSWTFQKARPAVVYGTPRLRALFALCAFIEGVPLLYQGDEDPAIWGGSGDTHRDYLARVYGLRHRLMALREGGADYDAVRATGGVFACVRGPRETPALVLISFNPDEVRARLRVPPGDWTGLWKDLMTGETLQLGTSLELPMAPHQVRLLVRSP